MKTLTSYNLHTLVAESPQTTLCRATSIGNGEQVLVRYLNATYPSLLARSRFKQEMDIAEGFDFPGILRPLRIETDKQDLLLVLEDFDGLSLARLIESDPLDLTKKIDIAIGVTAVLQDLHHRDIIHKNITADAILVNPETCEVRLTDFGLASRMLKETREQSDPRALDANLAYISPEQTGRMNRYIDYRSDFYSLGITLYRLFTRRLPFDSSDPLELVHSHIARPPIAPQKIDASIPAPLSRIIMKLLAKIAEDRYHSASGLREDLLHCRYELTASNFIAPFEPGAHDIPERFQIPQKLYGRQEEIETLLTAFERVSSGNVAFVLVSGYAGMGKSSIVQEVQRPIVRERGYFVQGKFDQFKRDFPYSSIIQAFRELVRQLLTEQEDQLRTWQNSLSAALGSMGQVLVEVIPEIELIIGPQQPVPALGPTESQNRFRLVFQRFIHVFAGESHPLVLFLDDLQWADSASLGLIETLSADPELTHLLFIGAYRDNEVNAAHPFALTREHLRRTDVTLHEIVLTPLRVEDLNDLICETLYCTADRGMPLTRLVYNKTAGNPFFIIEFLKALFNRKLLWFEKQEGKRGNWAWDLQQIENARITENVVELMVDNIQQLDIATQQALQIAACIGNRFDLKTLSIARETTPTQTVVILWDAIQKDFLRPIDDAFQLTATLDEASPGDSRLEDINVDFVFQHDRIQQAAYTLIPVEEKSQTHVKIGRLLLQNAVSEERDDQVFEIANHLNHGLDLITDPAERQTLMQLNLRAGQKAKSSTAYTQALTYLKAGLALMPPDAWDTDYELAFKLNAELAECEYLTTNFDAAEKRFDTILEKAQTPLDKLSVYNTRVRLLQHVGKEIESIEAGLAGLKIMGLEFPMHPGKVDLAKNLLKVMAAHGRKDIPSLIDLPDKMTPEIRATMDILMNLWGVTFWINQDLNGLLVLQMVRLSLKYGNADASSVAYVCYGVLQNVLGKVPKGLQYGQLSVDLADRFDSPYLRSKVAFISTSFFFHYTAPLRAAVEQFRQGLKYSLESGEFIYAGYCSNMLLWIMASAGHTLDKVLDEAKQLIDSAYQIENMQSVVSLQIIQRWASRLKGPAGINDTAATVSGFSDAAEHDEPAFAVDIFHAEAGRYDMELGAFYLWELQLNYLFGAYDRALKAVEQLQGNTIIEPTWAYLPSVYHLYYALVQAALYAEAPAETQKTYRKNIRKNLKVLKKYTSFYPDNFLHKYKLVLAEWERINGNGARAFTLYDEAARSARENGFIQNAAIAYERKALLHQERQQTIEARAYMAEARTLFQQWGAMARVRYLEAQYPNLLPATATAAFGELHTPNIGTLDALDLRTVLKASQTISGEIVLDRLLVLLMRNVMSNAGAERGALLLRTNEQLFIEAEGTVTPDEINVLQSIPLATTDHLANAVINYVARTKEAVVLDDASLENRFSSDPHIQAASPKSLLCMPLINQGNLTGLLYLENNLTTGAFTPDRIELLQLLSAEITISIENARLYNNLEQKVAERTEELNDKNTALAAAIEHLKQTRDQLVQAEKLASLGELAAGIAHEIKNPLNFINNFSRLNEDLAKDIRALIQNPDPEQDESTMLAIQDEITDMLSYLELNASKITAYGKRADNIVQSMMAHANGVTGKRISTDVKALILEVVRGAEAGMPLKYGNFSVEIQVDLPEAPLDAPLRRQEVGRVLHNIIENAIYALHERATGDADFTPQIDITAEQEAQQVWITIKDNGPGMPPAVRKKVFEPFFSTKPTGSGTGLGLSLSYDIIVKGHNGGLEVESVEGDHTTFTLWLPLDGKEDALITE